MYPFSAKFDKETFDATIIFLINFQRFCQDMLCARNINTKYKDFCFEGKSKQLWLGYIEEKQKNQVSFEIKKKEEFLYNIFFEVFDYMKINLYAIL